MGIFYGIINISILTLEFAVIGQLFLQTTQVKLRRLIAYIVMSVLVLATSKYYVDVIVLRYCGQLSAMIILIIIFEGPLTKKLFVIFCTALLNLVIETPISLGILQWIKINKELTLMDETCIRISTLLIITIIGLVLESKIKNISLWTKREWSVKAVIFKLTLTLIGIVISYRIVIKLTTKLQEQELLTCYYMLLLIVVIGVAIWEEQLRRQNLKELERLRQNYTAQELLFYERIERLQELDEVHKKKTAYEVKHIRTLIESGKVEEVENYASQAIEYVEEPIQTGNNIIDAIITQKCEVARAKGIVTNVKVSIPKKLYMETVDLCTLIAHGIDYGINQCQNIGSRLEIEGVFLNGYIIFKVKAVNLNKVHLEQLKHDEEKEKAQMLLATIKRYIVKYDGKVELDEDDESSLIVLSFNTGGYEVEG